MTGESQLTVTDFHRCKVFVHMLLSQKRIKKSPCGANLRQRLHGQCASSRSIQTLLIIFMGFNYFYNSHYSS